LRALFLHQNFPGQFFNVATALREHQAHELLAVVPESNKLPRPIPARTYPFDPPHARTNIRPAKSYTDRVARGLPAWLALLDRHYAGSRHHENRVQL
jgi:hypothetical protein